MHIHAACLYNKTKYLFKKINALKIFSTESPSIFKTVYRLNIISSIVPS